MTDYGRGSGSEPWHPEDPLFGDVYEQGYPQQQPPQQQPHPQQQGGWQDPYATGQHQQQYPQQQPDPQQGYPQQPQHPQQQHQPQQQPQQQQYGQQGYPQQHPQQGYEQTGYEGYDGYDTGSYQTGQVSGYAHDPYGGQQPQDPYGRQPGYYGQQGYPQQQPQQPQYQEHQPQPQPQQQPQQQPRTQQQPGSGQPGVHPGAAPQDHPQEPGVDPLRPAPAGTGEWDQGSDGDPHDHAFFADRDHPDADEDAPDASRTGGRRSGASQPQAGKKRRSGCACLVVLAVLVGGVGGAGYFGYHMYESRFGPPADFSGLGSGDTQVDIPAGASATTMGNILKKAGVVKSVGAFTSAAGKNPKGASIQAGVYDLHRQMSAAAAVTMMLDPKSQNAMIIPEGWRASRIYQQIDTKLKLKAGTTAAEAKHADLGLPSWAHGNLEGFLYPTKYGIATTMKPTDVLRQMVDQANAEYEKDDLVAAAKKVGESPEDILKIASLVQAEAQEDEDFGKVSRVVYNRLSQDTALGFDSTINYAKGRSTLNTSNADTQFPSPYNTYLHKGLPPGPIDNPGHDAIMAALNPTPGKWLYFVTVKPGDTRFTDSYAEHEKNVQAFNDYQKSHGG